MRFSRFYRKTTWLLLVALIAPTWLGPVAAANAMERVTMLVVCTGAGFRVINLPLDTLPIDVAAKNGDSHQVADAHCPACLVEVLGQCDKIARLDAPFLHRYWLRPMIVRDHWAAEPLCHRSLSSRAPPAI